ncbi:hypothetical protein, conserved [Babesia ovata]|uniref:Uncharacterized protein n=1 Tax=Babesia ovata TaxID=189622 RepID=A0A2H6K6V6_9APIC|nr:uncharacterized protein BOVATA_002270 [Babesia ovata]GBE58734.1 hypothetical protein, conserved [Babesia ovata]
MEYHSLRRIPRDFREGVDWLIALKGTYPELTMQALSDAIHRLLVDKPVGFTELPCLEKVKHISQQFLEQKEFKGDPFVEMLLKRYNTPMDKQPMGLSKTLGFYLESDYKNIIEAHGVRPESIARSLGRVVRGYEKFLEDIKHPDHYRPTYSSRATWDASCAKDPEACAIIFVGIAPMLFTGLLYLQETSVDAIRGGRHSEEEQELGSVLTTLGYLKPERSEKMSGLAVRTALRDLGDDALNILYDLAGFWAFY